METKRNRACKTRFHKSRTGTTSPDPGVSKEKVRMLSEQDKSEIRKSYRNAIDPRQHVKILMELYLASREEIEEALGFTHKEARRPIRRLSLIHI